jgi:hypothetical protein
MFYFNFIMQNLGLTDLFSALQLDFETAPTLAPCVKGMYLLYGLLV